MHQANDALNQQRSKMYELEFNLVHQYSKKTNVLDVGCSGGYFLDIFKKYGYKCYGVEFGVEAAKKYQIWVGDFPEIHIEKKFDLIIFRGVIEHISYPRVYLDKAISLLDKDALFYLTSTPNSNAFCCELFKENWNQHEPEAHLMHFNSSHFDEYFKTNGFVKVTQHNFYEETPYADVEEDILKVAKAIDLKRENRKIEFKSPAFYGNMMSLLYRKT